MHVYGLPGAVSFRQGASLYHPDFTVSRSSRTMVQVQFRHQRRNRVVGISDRTEETGFAIDQWFLASWAALIDEPGTPAGRRHGCCTR